MARKGSFLEKDILREIAQYEGDQFSSESLKSRLYSRTMQAGYTPRTY